MTDVLTRIRIYAASADIGTSDLAQYEQTLCLTSQERQYFRSFSPLDSHSTAIASETGLKALKHHQIDVHHAHSEHISRAEAVLSERKPSSLMASSPTHSKSKDPIDNEMLQRLRSQFATSLSEFTSSTRVFQVIYTVPLKRKPEAASTRTAAGRTLYVLDSSFNPPSQAHLTLAKSAVIKDSNAGPARILLLLATVNADKAVKPAAFEDRLVMMSIMAQNLRDELTQRDSSEEVPIDVAVTKKPYFMDKAMEIDRSGLFAQDAQQVHLVGYDTLVRIFDSKYYPQDQKLSVLQPFLSRHRLRVYYREDGKVSRQEQRGYVDRIADGSRESEGMRKEWAKMVELVDDAREVKGISSTKAREAYERGDMNELRSLVGDPVAKYVAENKLYTESAK